MQKLSIYPQIKLIEIYNTFVLSTIVGEYFIIDFFSASNALIFVYTLLKYVGRIEKKNDNRLIEKKTSVHKAISTECCHFV